MLAARAVEYIYIYTRAWRCTHMDVHGDVCMEPERRVLIEAAPAGPSSDLLTCMAICVSFLE
jgi:hypothetical protein